VLGLLRLIGDVLTGLGSTVVWALESVVNLFLSALAAFATTVLGLLPSIPAAPATPVSDWVGWLNWFFPLAPAIAAATTLLLLYTLMIGLRVALRWVKAL
jgi:uncharacterized membrane protein